MYRNIDSTYSKALEGRQVETAEVTPFNIRSLGAVSTIGKASLKSSKAQFLTAHGINKQ